MEINSFILFVEINRSNYTFIAGKYDDNQNFTIDEKMIAPNEGVAENKFFNVNLAIETVKKNITAIENKLDYVFKSVYIILDIFDYSCVNISGYKKLNQSQVLKDNISYILNSLKLIISENEKDKTILHIFNSKNILDGTVIENLPIGLFGDFYSHELTFYLIKNNDLKDIKKIFKKNNLNIEKILLKDFIEGVQLIDQNQKDENFFKINLGKTKSQISFFDKSSFRYSESFNFGSTMIIKDIEKVCSIKNEIINTILLDKPFKIQKYDEEQYFEEKFFINDDYRKIKKKLVYEIANSRIEEIIDIIFNKNINIESFKQTSNQVYFNVQDNLISENFKQIFENCIYKKNGFQIKFIDVSFDKLIYNAAKLSLFGWKKEAIPITQTKNSLITRIFQSIFE